MAVESSLKRFLKVLKERETLISMLFGALVVIAAAVLLVNLAQKNRSKVAVVVVAPQPTEAVVLPTKAPELNSIDIAQTLPSSEPTPVPNESQVLEVATPSAQSPSFLEKAGLFVLGLLKVKQANETPEVSEIATQSGETYSLNLVKNDQGELRAQNLPDSHSVAKGDSLWKIAEKYYGSGYNWVDIAKANNYKPETRLEIGQSLQLPNVTVRVPAGGKLAVVTQTAPVNQSGTTYVVQKGDNLWRIAVSQYQDGYQWTKIYTANKSLIKDPGLIEAGWVLTIPVK
jgi:nucleoid-associated protein YgaU